LFTGRRVDILDNGSLKLQYNRNRYYDQYTGRWLTQDPLGITPNPQKPNRFGVIDQYDDGLNLYEAVGSNPLIRSDPWGLFIVRLPDPFPPYGPWRGVDMEDYIVKRCKCVCNVADTFFLWRNHKRITDWAVRRGMNVFDTPALYRAMRHCLASGMISQVGCSCASCVGAAREEWQSGHGQSIAWHFVAEIGNRLGRRCAGCRGANADINPYGTTRVVACHDVWTVKVPTDPTVDPERLFECCKKTVEAKKAEIEFLEGIPDWW